MRILLLVLLICVAGALYKAGKLPYFQNNTPEEQTPTASVSIETTPSPTPQVTQTLPPTHSVEQATAQAIRLYPALAQKDSPFNKAFVLLYTQSKEKNPQLIATSDWPIRLANQVAASLGVAPQAVPVATPVAAIPASTPLAATPKPTPWQPMSTRMDQPKHKK